MCIFGTIYLSFRIINFSSHHQNVMDYSPHASEIEITRLIEHFDDENIMLFKECLLDELQCQDEQEWLAFVIELLWRSMTSKSMTTLRDKAIELAESQYVTIENSQLQHTYDSNTKQLQKQFTCSLYQMVQLEQQQYNDKLSNLPSDIIDHISKYFSKKESIKFGYLNKQLYIESQKQSYITKQQDVEAKVLKLNDLKIDRILWKQSQIFPYSTPTYLFVTPMSMHPQNSKEQFQMWFQRSSKRSTFFSSHWFRRMFTRLRGFNCSMYDCLPYVPVDLFFGVNKNNYNGIPPSKCSTNNYNEIEYLNFYVGEKISIDKIRSVLKFCDNFLRFKYYNDIKCIHRLQIQGLIQKNTNFFTKLRELATNELLITLGPVSGCIELSNCQFKLNNHDDELQVEKLFGKHSRTKVLCVIGCFNGEIINNYGYVDNNQLFPNAKSVSIATNSKESKSSLNKIVRHIRKIADRVPPVGDRKYLKFLHELDDCGVTKGVCCYKLICGPNISKGLEMKRIPRRDHDGRYRQMHHQRRHNPRHVPARAPARPHVHGQRDQHYIPLNRTAERNNLDNVLFGINIAQRPLLKNLVIQLTDNRSLVGIANIFLYLIENKRKLLLRRYECNIDVIKIIVYLRGKKLSSTIRPLQPRRGIQMFSFAKDQDYDSNKNTIDVSLSKCDSEEMGIIYQNLINWFRKTANQINQELANNKTKTIKIYKTIVMKINRW